jgi:hypothetical protein
MKKPIGTSIAVMMVIALAATMLTGLAPGTLNASARQHTQAVAAHQAFVKFMSSHAPMIRATGSASTRATGSAATQVTNEGAVLSATANAAQASSSPETELASYNWSGFADAQNTTGTGVGATGPGSQPTTSVSASWTIPQVSCVQGQYRNQDVFIANWVGLDGFNDGTVEQLGTATQCYENVEYYYDWYEMFPNNTVEEGTTQCISDNIDCPRPGDQITASVVSTTGKGATSGDNDYTLSLTDSTNHAESFSVSATCPAATCVNSSAEWVVERPAFGLPFGFQILPQAYYGQTGFTNGTVGVGFKTYSIEQYPGQVYDMPMIDDSASYFLSCPGQQGPPGQLLLIPTSASSPPGCGLTTPYHGSFSDTWDSSF